LIGKSLLGAAVDELVADWANMLEIIGVVVHIMTRDNLAIRQG
jgi:hypothetical protein